MINILLKKFGVNKIDKNYGKMIEKCFKFLKFGKCFISEDNIVFKNDWKKNYGIYIFIVINFVDMWDVK